jgi:hypothetical protein
MISSTTTSPRHKPEPSKCTFHSGLCRWKLKQIYVTLSSRVISSPLAVSIDHIDKRSRETTISLLTRMQRIIPKERVRVRSSNTISAVCGAVVDIASHSRVSTIQILCRVVVHIGNLIHLLASTLQKRRGEKKNLPNRTYPSKQNEHQGICWQARLHRECGT